MKAAVIEEQGAVETIVYRDWPDPEPGPGEVRVAVRACGLNHLDIFVRRGMPGFPVPMPFISGGDVAGTIDTLGPGVEGWAPGERVTLNPQTDGGMLGEEILGGLAELVVVPARNLVRLPDTLAFETAAAIPINYGTAHRMLYTRGRLAAGETMLVLGASGGVGIACLQFGKMTGARVIAAAGSAEKCARLAALGADHAIDYSEEDFSRAAWLASDKKGCDVVVNFTGGDTWAPCLRTAKRGGRVLTCGATAGHDPANRPALYLGPRARRAGLQQLFAGGCRALGRACGGGPPRAGGQPHLPAGRDRRRRASDGRTRLLRQDRRPALIPPFAGGPGGHPRRRILQSRHPGPVPWTQRPLDRRRRGPTRNVWFSTNFLSYIVFCPSSASHPLHSDTDDLKIRR